MSQSAGAVSPASTDLIAEPWRDVPMPVDYTCGCGIYVHPTKRNPTALHISGCPYEPALMSQFLRIEWVPQSWWLVEVTGRDGSYTPLRELPNPRRRE